MLHDVDRLSSLLIHVVPLKFIWRLRWFPTDTDEWGFNNVETTDVGFGEFFMTPIYFFLIHNIFYCIVIFGIKKKKLEEGKYDYSFKYMTGEGGAYNRLAKKLGKTKTKFVFILAIWLAFFVYNSFAYLCFISFYFHTAWVALLVIVAAKNGASFYIDYFARKYE